MGKVQTLAHSAARARVLDWISTANATEISMKAKAKNRCPAARTGSASKLQFSLMYK